MPSSRWNVAFKKSDGVLRQRVQVKYAFITRERSLLPVRCCVECWRCRPSMITCVGRQRHAGIRRGTASGSPRRPYGQSPDLRPPRLVRALRDRAHAVGLKRVAHLWRSLTWDRGKKLSDQARFTIESGMKVFFPDPHGPWQRGKNENTNGLLRPDFPKGTDLSRWSAPEIQAVTYTLNTRFRKTLGWKISAEALDEHLKSIQRLSVATTG